MRRMEYEATEDAEKHRVEVLEKILTTECTENFCNLVILKNCSVFSVVKF